MPASRKPDELRLSFLPVGHGGCILIECPGGQVLMYDCGSFGDGDRAAQSVFATMSARGMSHIDALLISHADSDHYNGVIPLIERVPVGVVFTPRQFLDFEQTLVADTCDAIAHAGAPIRLLRSGDVLQVDSRISFQVLHPRDEFDDELDNANSLVLLIEFAGRRMLLTGDLEGEGLVALSQLDLGGPTHILQSPHHGSLAANTPELRDWTAPDWMIVCAGRDADLARLSDVFPETRVLSTWASGTITFTIDADGHMEVGEHLATSDGAQ
jgi:competence protein ComEC